LHAHNCGFSSKFVTVDGKYRKCQKNLHFYSINHISGNPGPISRESGIGKIVGIPGTVNPGNETLPVSDLFGLKLSLFCGVANDGAAIVIEWFSISSTFFSAFFNMVDA
jgi:hypothetical protein